MRVRPSGTTGDSFETSFPGKATLEESTHGDFEHRTVKINRIVWEKSVKLGLTVKQLDPQSDQNL